MAANYLQGNLDALFSRFGIDPMAVGGGLGIGALVNPFAGLITAAILNTLSQTQDINQQIQEGFGQFETAAGEALEMEEDLLGQTPIFTPGPEVTGMALTNWGFDLEELARIGVPPSRVIRTDRATTPYYDVGAVSEATGRPIIPVEGMFSGPFQTQLDYFAEHPLRTSLGVSVEPTREEVRRLFGEAAAGFEALPGIARDLFGEARGVVRGFAEEGGLGITGADLLAGVEMPETDLSEVLGARLGGIGAVGAKRQQLAQQELAGMAGALGGLENLKQYQATLGFEESSRRALEAAEAVGQTRAEELEAQKWVSDLQTGAATEAAQINRALAEMLGEFETFATGSILGTDLGVASALGQLFTGQAGMEMGLTGLETDISKIDTMLENAVNRYMAGLYGGVETGETAEQLLLADRAFQRLGFEQNVIQDLLGGQAGIFQLLLASMAQQMIPDLASYFGPFAMSEWYKQDEGTTFGIDFGNIFKGIFGGGGGGAAGAAGTTAGTEMVAGLNAGTMSVEEALAMIASGAA